MAMLPAAHPYWGCRQAGFETHCTVCISHCCWCGSNLDRANEMNARDARSIPPQAETGSMQIAKAIVNHAAKPLVSAERRREIQLFVDTIKLVENAFHCKLRGDTDLSGDILIFDQANPLPSGYEFSAYIEPNGHLEFTEWVLDDEVGIEGMKQ